MNNSFEEKFNEILKKCKKINIIAQQIVHKYKDEINPEYKMSKIQFQKLVLISAIEWCNRITNNFISLYNVEKENSYFSIVPMNRFAVELLVNFEVIVIIQNIIKTKFTFLSTGGEKYKLFEEYVDSHLNPDRIREDLLIRLLTFNFISDQKDIILSEKRDDPTFSNSASDVVKELLKNQDMHNVIKNIHKDEPDIETEKIIRKFGLMQCWDGSNFKIRLEFVKAGRLYLSVDKKEALHILNYLYKIFSKSIHANVFTHVDIFGKNNNNYYFDEMCNSILVFYPTIIDLYEKYDIFFNCGESNSVDVMLKVMDNIKSQVVAFRKMINI